MSDWSEVVIVQDTHIPGNQPGRYALVRASDWCQYGDEVILWRGPKKPDEAIETARLTEVSCKAVLVDKEGFFICTPSEEPLAYPCPQVTEELKEAIEEESEKILSEFADQHAAEVTSYIDYERLLDRLGHEWSDKIWALAQFDDGLALNGEPATREQSKHPKGWVETDLGGRTDGGETEVYKSDLVGSVSHLVSEKLKLRIDNNTTRRVLDMIYPGKDYVIWNSGYGDSWVWVSKAAMRKLEAQDEKERRGKILRQQQKIEAERKAREEQRRREIEEYRAKLRKGGALAPREWSPRGRMPGERD